VGITDGVAVITTGADAVAVGEAVGGAMPVWQRPLSTSHVSAPLPVS